MCRTNASYVGPLHKKNLDSLEGKTTEWVTVRQGPEVSIRNHPKIIREYGGFQGKATL